MKSEYIGDYGEMCAARYLRRQGVSLVASQYRTRLGEVDLIFWEKGTLVFAEVKTRTPGMFARPGESVDAAKQRRIVLASAAYLAHKKIDAPCRFDVLEVYLNDDDGVDRVLWLKDAFDAEGMNI